MFKKSISFFIMVAIVSGAMLTVTAQNEDNSYKMWEDIMITPDYAKLKVLGENMRKHNQKYHKEGPHKATVYNITTGPNAGKIIWEMGPMTYADLDKRPSVGGHDEDWRDNIDPYIKKMHTVEYWKDDNELNNTAMLDGDNSKYPIILVRYFEVVDGLAPGVRTFFERVSKTNKALEGENPWGVYYNEFRQGDLGRHIATFRFHPNWADFDRNVNWTETFEKVNGNNSMQNQRELYRTTFKNAWDEIWVYNKEMSGD
ncbi:hypothetical protein [Winogradskyella sp. A2]|uniref:hypothetical protein n=1 Tax=Winogradskyella sp. A2 TaxID=3366944 RepID=UPI00398C2CC9